MKDAFHKDDPAADDTLYILTAAASNSYYFLDELYGMLAAAGVKAKVCSLYRGSTGINLYYDYWKKGENVFQLIIHDKNGVTTLEGMNPDLALKYYNWDVYNMQDGNAPTVRARHPRPSPTNGLWHTARSSPMSGKNVPLQSCIGNTFRPKDYPLSEELVTVLQQSAHQAVEELQK